MRIFDSIVTAAQRFAGPKCALLAEVENHTVKLTLLDVMPHL
jgi:hypothetical protein